MELTRKELLRITGGASAAALLGLVPKPAQGHTNLPRTVTDAVTHRAYDAVKGWTNWLERNNARGYFSETGWPNAQEGPRLYADGTSDIPQWQTLGKKVYSWLDNADVWMTYWTAGVTQSPSIFKVYGASDPEAPIADRVIGEAYGQAPIIERARFLSSVGVKRGVNANGGELLGMGEERFSNENSGVYGLNYVYPNRKSLAYLAGRGHKLIRLPFRWERVQPTIGGNLSGAEVERLKTCVANAKAEGLVVILDLHNRGRYYFPAGKTYLGTTGLPVSAFPDFWRRFSRQFKDVPGVAGYQLMNEPINMPGGAAQWERASQAAVNAIRANGDKKRLMVSGYHEIFNPHRLAVFAFTANHPKAWINDPPNKTVYSTHGYWGFYGYRWTYRETNAYLKRFGWDPA